MPVRAVPLLVAVLALAACGKADETATPAAAAAEPHHTALCALNGTSAFAPDCTVERGEADGAQTITVRHPDGGFRRFVVSADGQNLLSADGAEEAQSALKDGRYEVILGQDRYVIPAAGPGDAAAR